MDKPDIMDFTGDLPEDVVDEIGHTVDYFATLEPNDLRKIYKESYKTIKQTKNFGGVKTIICCLFIANRWGQIPFAGNKYF